MLWEGYTRGKSAFKCVVYILGRGWGSVHGYTHTITVAVVFCIQVLRVTLDSCSGFDTCANSLFAVYEIQLV